MIFNGERNSMLWLRRIQGAPHTKLTFFSVGMLGSKGRFIVFPCQFKIVIYFISIYFYIIFPTFIVSKFFIFFSSNFRKVCKKWKQWHDSNLKKKTKINMKAILCDMTKQDREFPAAIMEMKKCKIIIVQWYNVTIWCVDLKTASLKKRRTLFEECQREIVWVLEIKIIRAGCTHQWKISPMAYFNYYEHVTLDGSNNQEHIWDATEMLGCKHHKIDEYNVAHFDCALGECSTCPEYKPHPL